MKKLYFILCIFYSATTYSQIYIGCYTHEDTLSNSVIDNTAKFKLDPKYNETEVKLKSFELTIFGEGNAIIYNKTLSDAEITPEIRKKMNGAGKLPTKIIFENILVTGPDGPRKMTSTTFYRAKVVKKKC